MARRSASARFAMVAGAALASPSAQLTFTEEFSGSTLSMRNTPQAGTNRIRNSSAFIPLSATAPENWTLSVSSGLTGTITAVAGSTAIDLRLVGTAPGAGTCALNFDAAFAAAPSEIWTLSETVSVSAGTTTNASNYGLSFDFYDTNGTFLAGGFSNPVLSGTPTRSSVTATAPALTASTRPYITLGVVAGAVDITLRLAQPQHEKAASASAYVATTPNGGTWNTRLPNGSYTGAASQQSYNVDYAYDGTSLSGGNNPFSVAGGALTITGATASGGAGGKTYTTGVITTKNGFSQLYGYFEAAMQMPAGQGLWPAFRLVRQDGVTTVEVDIEQRGDQTTTAYLTAKSTTLPGNQTQFTPTISNPTTSFHLWGIDWTASSLAFYFDRQLVSSLSTPTNMNAAMFMQIGLDLGGTFPGNVVNTGQIPAQFKIDAVRVYSQRPFF